MELEVSARDPLISEFLDPSEITEENKDDVEWWISFLDSTYDPKDEKREYLTDELTDYFKSTFGALPLLIGAHEGLHAIGAKLAGGEILGAGINSKGVYVTIEYTPTTDLASTLLPSLVIPTFGFYMIKKWKEDKKLKNLGIGLASLILSFGSIPFEYGDFSTLGAFKHLAWLGSAVVSYTISKFI